MYADDLILLAKTKEDLQKKIDILNDYCMKWKLEINSKKTKTMIFNRGNKLIKTIFTLKNEPLENVKTFKYLGFTISAKNCSFTPTSEDLSTRANRAIYALNNKIKISKLPVRLAKKIFDSQIAPILLYGAEVWGPYLDYDFKEWDGTKIEQVQTQFLKRVLGCNIQTSNIMSRGEVGARPLLVEIIKRVILYHNKIVTRNSSITMAAIMFEKNNNILPNFVKYINKFNLNLDNLSQLNKDKAKTTCHKLYDVYWWSEIIKSPKAASYALFKNEISLETYLHQIYNRKHLTAISRFRLSNHDLMIEKGRHSRPRIEKDKRFCFHCKHDIENELHFVTKCPLYDEERTKLYSSCQNNARQGMNFNLIPTNEQKFIFILTSKNVAIIKSFANFIYNSSKLREIAQSHK